jgi:hypothetical protein
MSLTSLDMPHVVVFCLQGELICECTIKLTAANTLHINYSYVSNNEPCLIYSLLVPPVLDVSSFRATTTEVTIVNLASHVYFNLSGGCEEDIRGHVLRLACNYYLPVSSEGIPTGAVAAVADTPYDLRGTGEGKTAGHLLGPRLSLVGTNFTKQGFDHCYCRELASSTRSGSSVSAAPLATEAVEVAWCVEGVFCPSPLPK